MLDSKEKETWLNALRSGKYKQIVGTLTDGYGFCCIGVYGECNNIPLDEKDDDEWKPYAKLISQIGRENTQALWVMNDTERKSFLEIADYIEQNL